MSDASSAVVVLQPYLLALAAMLLLVASLHDIASRTIPDFASLGLLAIGVVVRVLNDDATAALIASTLVFSLGALCWRFGYLGGGDAKLLAACAWLVSPALVPQFVLCTAIAGGILAGLYLTLSCVARASRAPAAIARPPSQIRRIGRVEWWRIRRRAPLPYGCAIAVGTLFTLSGR